MIYIFHFLIILILYIFFGRHKQTEKTFAYSTFIYILFVFGQRWMTGTDFPNYLTYYLVDFIKSSEWLYFGLQILFRKNNLYFGLFILVIFTITELNFYRFFKKINQKYALIIALFLISELFFGQMSQIRQFAAISFFLNAYYNSYEKKYPAAILNIVLAAAFHSSAIFFTPFLFIKIPLNKRLFLTFLGIAMIFPIIDIHFLFNLPFLSKYSAYLGGYFDVPLGLGHAVKYYVMLVIFIFFTVHLKQIQKNRINQFILNGLMFYILMYGVSMQFALLYRITKYFQIFELLFLAYYSDKLINIPDYLSRKVVLLLFSGIFFSTALIDSSMIMDYEFRALRFFENRTDEELMQEINSFYD